MWGRGNMQFTRLWPLCFLIAIPALILLYMLRKQNQQRMISSTFLWQEILEHHYAERPWQKLRKNRMLLLQILAVLLAVLALMAPYIHSNKGFYKNVVFVVDTSASMSAVNNQEEETRFELAKKWMADYMQASNLQTKAYIIQADDTPALILAGSSDKNTVLSTIETLDLSYSAGAIKEALSMAKALGESLNEAYEIVLLTDQKQAEEEMEQPNYHGVYFGNSGMNGAITHMSYDYEGQQMIILVQVQNKGNAVFASDVSLYNGDKLLDVAEITLQTKESKTLRFTLPLEENALSDSTYFKAELATKDLIEADNCYYYVPSKARGKKILLVTEGNIFLEKALMSVEGSEVYKTTTQEAAFGEETYDLYVFDNQTLTKLPKVGNVLMINSTAPDLPEGKTSADSYVLKSEGEQLPEYIKKIDFTVSGCTSYTLPYWAKALFTNGADTVGFMGMQKGQKIAMLGFDIWQSDFALKADFPLFMYYLTNQLLDYGAISQSNYIAGEKLRLSYVAGEEDYMLYSPDGKGSVLHNSEVSLKKQLGIYQLVVDKKEPAVLFSANYPAATESNVEEEVVGEMQLEGDTKLQRATLDLTPYMILLFLIIILTEWYFYRKGY